MKKDKIKIPEYQIKLGMLKLQLIFSKDTDTYTDKEKEAMRLFRTYNRRIASEEALRQELI